MDFTREQFAQTITQIGTCTDDAERRTLLASLQTNGDTLFDEYDSLQEKNEQLTTKNKNLQDYNMELFLQVGNKKKPGEEQHVETQPERLKFEDLFDEKGGLK